MPKSLLIIGWTLLVATTAFIAGRWTLNVPTTQTDSGLVVSNEPVNSMPVMLEKVAAPNTHINVQQIPSAPIRSSYATDSQQLQLLIALAATNPQLAMEKIQQFKGVIRAKAQAAILEVWGSVDPNAAWNWVQSFQPENNAQFIKLLEVIGRSEPRTAMAYAEKYVEGHRELRKDIYSSLVAGLTQNGAYSVAIDLVGRLEIEADTKTELTDSIVSAWATYEPQSAMRWVMTQSEEVRDAKVERMAKSWSDTDPQGAVNFAAAQIGALREALLLPSFKKWLAADPATATAWLAAVQRDKDFDAIIAELAIQPSTNNSDVRAALAWTGQIHNAELRVNTVVSILSAFKQKDPKSAAAYLQEVSYLTEPERARLVEDLAF